MTLANKINEPGDNENEESYMFDENSLDEADMEGLLIFKIIIINMIFPRVIDHK